MAGVGDLKEFIQYAEKNRKYAAETAKGRRAALKLFEDELNDDEAQSVDLIEDRIDKIYQAVFQKNKQSIKANSLSTYKSRMLGLLKDYKKYGSDPNLFNAWDTTRKHEPKVSLKNQKVSKRATTMPVEAELIDAGQNDNQVRQFLDSSTPFFSSDLNSIDVYLRPGFKVSLHLPIDLTSKEANRLKHMIDGMIADDDQGRIQEI